jgi:hypothetical protein
VDFYAKHLRTIAIKAIRPLAELGGAGTASAGELAALPAGQVAGLDHMLT